MQARMYWNKDKRAHIHTNLLFIPSTGTETVRQRALLATRGGQGAQPDFWRKQRSAFHFSYISFPLLVICLYTPPLFYRLGVIRLHAAIFHLHARPLLISHLFVLLSLLWLPCMPPFSQRLGITHLRATIFYLHAHALQFLIYFSYPSSCFPLYASTLPAIRGYTLARCYFASARARPSMSH